MHAPVSIMGRVTTFFRYTQPTAKVVIVFPMWETQPWYATMLTMCDAAFELPGTGKSLYRKIANLPGPDYIRNANWRFAVGLRNVGVKHETNWPRL